MRVIWVIAILMIAGVSVIQAAPSYLGPSGVILTPDEKTVPHKQFGIGYHMISNIDFRGDDNRDLNIFHNEYGLTPSIEIGPTIVDQQDNGSDLAINGKWRFMDETAKIPAIAVGVLDASGNAIDDNASFYLLFSKNLTRTATEVAKTPSKPLRGTIGVGSGFFDGIFASLDWTYNPQLSVMAEIVNGGDFFDNTMVNAGLRYSISSGLRLDLATIDFDSIAFGISYTGGF
ncbi:MAG: YjbH domain-containing protein [Armatimonadota bacterium]